MYTGLDGYHRRQIYSVHDCNHNIMRNSVIIWCNNVQNAERRVIVQCARILKIPTLCSLSSTLCPPIAFKDLPERTRCSQ